MSTVLWANRLSDGVVVSDESDKFALYKHLAQIDKIARGCGLAPLSEMCDHTDLRFNTDEDLELPMGMASTKEWMAAQGVWVEAEVAVSILTTLSNAIERDKPRFGLLRNDYDAVLAELRESLAFARAMAESGAKFNFSVVM